MFIKPLTAYHTFDSEFLTLSALRRATGLSHRAMVRILRDAPLPVYLFPAGTRCRYLLETRHAEALFSMCNPPREAARRRAHWERCHSRPPVIVECPRCHKTGAHQRGGFTSAGNRVLRCNSCRRWHTLAEKPEIPPNAEPPPACPCCASVARQTRHGRTSRGLPRFQCTDCRKTYTPGAVNRLPLRACCPACSRTTRQYRRSVNAAGNLAVRCGHCAHLYLVFGIPDPKVRPEDNTVLRHSNDPDNPFASHTPQGALDW